MRIAGFVLAYIDPGTGSLIVQGLIAIVAGAGVTARLYWKSIKRFFGAAPGESDDDDPDPPAHG
jgi:hypothetical protein